VLDRPDGLTFVCSHSSSERCVSDWSRSSGALLVAVFIAALLSIPQVADLFKERASLEQSYDSGPMADSDVIRRVPIWHSTTRSALARCNSPILPGGPAQHLPELVHVGGWMAGISYLTLTLVTVVSGCASFSSPRHGGRPIRRSTSPIWAWRRERHHRHRSLAPLFPRPRRSLGSDGGLTAVPQERRTTAATGRDRLAQAVQIQFAKSSGLPRPPGCPRWDASLGAGLAMPP